jgi:hypothetical protein
MTDYFSNIVAQEETFTRGNSKENCAKRPTGRREFESKANVGIKGNKTADKEAKAALNQEVDNTYKVVKSD